jgi:hypothetical protein
MDRTFVRSRVLIKRDFPKIHFYDQDFVDIYDKTWAWIQDCWSSGNEKVAMLHAALGEHATSGALPVDKATQAAKAPGFPVEIMVDAELSSPVILADSPMVLPTALSAPDNSTASEESAPLEVSEAEPESSAESVLAEGSAPVPSAESVLAEGSAPAPSAESVQDAAMSSESVPDQAGEPESTAESVLAEGIVPEH